MVREQTYLTHVQGSGKTTLLNSIANRLEPSMKVEGTIKFKSQSRAELSQRKIEKVSFLNENELTLQGLSWIRYATRYSASKFDCS